MYRIASTASRICSMITNITILIDKDVDDNDDDFVDGKRSFKINFSTKTATKKRDISSS